MLSLWNNLPSHWEMSLLLAISKYIHLTVRRITCNEHPLEFNHVGKSQWLVRASLLCHNVLKDNVRKCLPFVSEWDIWYPADRPSSCTWCSSLSRLERRRDHHCHLKSNLKYRNEFSLLGDKAKLKSPSKFWSLF